MSPIVPFTISTDGLDEINGLAYLEGEFLVLDVNVTFMGLTSKDKERIKVAPTAIAGVEIGKRAGGLAGPRITLRPASPELLDVVPGAHKGTIKLNVPRKHAADARTLVAALGAQFDPMRAWDE